MAFPLVDGGGSTKATCSGHEARAISPGAHLTSLGPPEGIVMPAAATLIEKAEIPTQVARETSRPGLDVVLVLDRSGSMGLSPLGAAPRSSIEALRDAVQDLARAWADVRASERASPSDRLGIVLFDSSSAWWSPIAASGLAEFEPARVAIEANAGSISPGGMTSIGAGLLLADAAFATADPSRRRVVLVMSDGMQNRGPLVGVTPTQPFKVFAHSSGSTTGPHLPNQANYQIYTVTVGTGVAVSAAINAAMAAATQGFYVNSEISAESLRTFFIELLQDFVRFNTWQTARLANGTVVPGAPVEVVFPVSSTTTHVSVAVVWPPQFGSLSVHITPPGESTVTEIGSGSVRRLFQIAEFGSYDHLGEWKVVIDSPGVATALHYAGAATAVPVDVHVLVDDRGVTAHMDIADHLYEVGRPIKLRVRVSEMGRPVLGLGTRPGETVVAKVVRPALSIGDLLAGSTASAEPTGNEDEMSPAAAKLFNELQDNPGALSPEVDVITLADPDGDGDYTAEYPTREPGHYTFVFAVQGRTNEAGTISRQQLKSVFVRAVPDASQTSISVDTISVEGTQQLTLSVTLRTKYGHLLGPGFANYLWFTSPGRQPFKPIDNLDGSYTAHINYPPGSVPSIGMHFLSVPILIDDDVTPDRLPLPLDDRTTVIAQIPGTGNLVSGCLLILVTAVRHLARMLRSE